MIPRSLILLAFIFATVHSAFASFAVGSLNCYFFVSPQNHEKAGLKREPLSPDVFEDKIGNLATLIQKSGAEFVGLEEIGSEIEANALAGRLSSNASTCWMALFVQGRDHYTGQDVAVVYRARPGLKIDSVSRSSELEDLSKHLVVHASVDGAKYAVLVVHLIRPIGENQVKHRKQLADLTAWAKAQTREVIILGDFNNDGKRILPLGSINEQLGWPATHLGGKGFDYIFSSAKLGMGRVEIPPYGRKPNDLQKTLWTDHYMISAVAP